jgi:hypothetical protein
MKFRIVKDKDGYRVEEHEEIGYDTREEAERDMEIAKGALYQKYGDGTNYKVKNRELMESMRKGDNDKVKRSYRL